MKKYLRNFAVLTLAFVAASGAFAKIKNQKKEVAVKMEKLRLDSKWDKVFPKSDKVDHKKVTFVNHFGITIAADMYTPKSVPAGGRPCLQNLLLWNLQKFSSGPKPCCSTAVGSGFLPERKLRPAVLRQGICFKGNIWRA
ncbi:hypothetical protein [uncultured Treponema sp.]|uniref:hypothetical protein n=1 Tax=uncultured Treponema sp. TaxID=162155 RepID=UPI002599C7B9|nr:hypothetical protein [uncultured Treponema sp.]